MGPLGPGGFRRRGRRRGLMVGAAVGAAAARNSNPAPQPAEQPAEQYAPAAPAPEQPDTYAELEKLGQLKAEGILTDEEFTAKKKQILGL